MISHEHIGFAGLGGMGTAIAALLCQHSEDPGKLSIYNRSKDRLTAFVEEHPGTATSATAPTALASCTVTFSILANDAAVEDVFTQYLHGVEVEDSESPPEYPKLYIDMSTVLPSTTRKLAALAATKHVTYLACPVFGRPPAAAAGQLLGALSGGTEAVRERAKRIIFIFAGKGVLDLGDDVGSAHALKLSGNFYIAGQIELASECLALAEKSGVDQGAALKVMETIAAGGITVGYANRIAAGDYNSESGFAVDLALKDIGHVRTLAREVVCPLPTADTVFNHLLATKANHGGELDWGSVALSVRHNAGLHSNENKV